MKFKKGLFLLAGTALLAGSLASCNKPNEVTIKNPDGSTEKVELTETKDEAVVRKACAYLSQADYTEVDGLKLSFGYYQDSKLNDDNKIKNSISGSLTLAIEDAKNAKFYANGEMKVSFNERLQVPTPGAPVPGEVTENKLLMTNKLYVEPGDLMGPVAYLESAKQNPDSVSTRRIKASLSELIGSISGSITPELPIGPNIPTEPTIPSMPDMPEMPAAKMDIALPTQKELYDALMEKLPNSSLEISEVGKKDFTFKLDASVNDILVNAGYEAQATDSKVQAYATFDLKSGRFMSLSFECYDKSILPYMFEGSDLEVSKDAFLSLKLSLNASYGKQKITKLTDIEKAAYDELRD